MSLFTFHNEFDDVTVTLDDDSPLLEKQGPYSVTLTFGDRAISTDEPSRFVFENLGEAVAKFTELCTGEITAVLGEIK